MKRRQHIILFSFPFYLKLFFSSQILNIKQYLNQSQCHLLTLVSRLAAFVEFVANNPSKYFWSRMFSTLDCRLSAVKLFQVYFYFYKHTLCEFCKSSINLLSYDCCLSREFLSPSSSNSDFSLALSIASIAFVVRSLVLLDYRKPSTYILQI